MTAMTRETDTVAEEVQRHQRFYSVAEVATLLGVSEPTVYRAIRAGELAAVRLRGRYVVPARAIDAMEASALATVGGVE
jgi:excisionase family DNA binding protein